MKLIAMEIPISPGEIADWLEEILRGGDLRSLGSELSAVSATDEPVPELRVALGSQLPSMLESGFSSLPGKTVRRLLSQPSLLLDLQELAMTEGGEYWQNKFETDVNMSTIQRTRLSVEPLSSLTTNEERKNFPAICK